MNWHRLFGLVLTDFFTGSPFVVELEKDLSIKKQLLDVVILRKDQGKFAGRLPDGLDNLAAHNLITFKSHQEALDARGAVWDLVDGAEVARRFPGVAPPVDAKILFQPDAGVLAADRALRAMVQVATARGVELRERTRVSAMRPAGAAIHR